MKWQGAEKGPIINIPIKRTAFTTRMVVTTLYMLFCASLIKSYSRKFRHLCTRNGFAMVRTDAVRSRAGRWCDRPFALLCVAAVRSDSTGNPTSTTI